MGREPREQRPGASRLARAGRRTLSFGIIASFVSFAAFPFLWMLITMDKQQNDLLDPNHNPFLFHRPPTLENLQTLFNDMKAEAVPLGEKLIAQEAELDRQFAIKQVTPVSLSSATLAIGATQGALRNAHLKYHLATLAILTAAQIARYAELRGYQAGAQPHAPHRHK